MSTITGLADLPQVSDQDLENSSQAELNAAYRSLDLIEEEFKKGLTDVRSLKARIAAKIFNGATTSPHNGPTHH